MVADSATFSPETNIYLSLVYNLKCRGKKTKMAWEDEWGNITASLVIKKKKWMLTVQNYQKRKQTDLLSFSSIFPCLLINYYSVFCKVFTLYFLSKYWH